MERLCNKGAGRWTRPVPAEAVTLWVRQVVGGGGRSGVVVACGHPAEDAAPPCLSPKGLIPAKGIDTDILHAEGV